MRGPSFKVKMVRLELPGCPPVMFDPHSCDWMQENGQLAEDKDAQTRIDALRREQQLLEEACERQRFQNTKQEKEMTSKQQDIRNQDT